MTMPDEWADVATHEILREATSPESRMEKIDISAVLEASKGD